MALVGGDVVTGKMPDSIPSQIRAFFSACLLPAARLRPQSAWDLHDEFDALLKKVVGKREYRPFKMP